MRALNATELEISSELSREPETFQISAQSILIQAQSKPESKPISQNPSLGPFKPKPCRLEVMRRMSHPAPLH